jgi:hypothetical protein
MAGTVFGLQSPTRRMGLRFPVTLAARISNCLAHDPDAVPSSEEYLHHTLRFGLPNPPNGFRETPMPEGAEAIVERLLRSFKASVERDTGNRGEIWGRIIREL